MTAQLYTLPAQDHKQERLVHSGTDSVMLILEEADIERCLVDLWGESNANTRNSSAAPLLQTLLNPRRLPTWEIGVLSPFDTITQRDATVAATIVQWLGTEKGVQFLTEAFQRAGYKFSVSKIS